MQSLKSIQLLACEGSPDPLDAIPPRGGGLRFRAPLIPREASTGWKGIKSRTIRHVQA